MPKNSAKVSTKIRKQISELESIAGEIALYGLIPGIVAEALAGKSSKKVVAKIVKNLEAFIDRQVATCSRIGTPGQRMSTALTKNSEKQLGTPNTLDASEDPLTYTDSFFDEPTTSDAVSGETVSQCTNPEEGLSLLKGLAVTAGSPEFTAVSKHLSGARVKFIKKVQSSDPNAPTQKEYCGVIRSFATGSDGGVNFMVKTDQHFMESVPAADCELE